MSNFSIAFRETMAHEGGYANVTGDKGGETYAGPVTAKKMELIDSELIYKAVQGFQFIKYHSIINKDQSQKKFSKGWIKRI